MFDVKNKEIIFSLLFYWLVFIAFPFWLADLFKNSRSDINISGVAMIYIIFIAPFLYIIPFKVVGIKDKKEKLYFIIWGLVVPYALIYLFVFYKVVKTFQNSNFPF